MRVRVLHCTSQRQELDIFELNVLKRFVFAFAWIELRNDAVFNVSLIVHDHDVSHANILVVERRLAQVADNLDEVLIALKAFDSERNARHDRLFLLDDHARVGADGPQIEVVLNPEGETQHQCQQQEKPGSETSYLGRKLHVKLRGT